MRPAQPRLRPKRIHYLAIAALITFTAGALLHAGKQNLHDADIQTYLVKTRSVAMDRPGFRNPFAIVETRDVSPQDVSASADRSRVYLQALTSKPVESTISGFPYQAVSGAWTEADRETLRQQKIKFQRAREELLGIQQILQAFYKTNDNWPMSFEEAGVNPQSPELHYINKLKLRSRGEFVADLTSDLGSDKIIRLTPENPDHDDRIRWHCRTNVTNAFLGIGRDRNCIYSRHITGTQRR